MNMDMSGDLAAAGLGPVLDPRAPIEVEPSEWNYTMRREMQVSGPRGRVVMMAGRREKRRERS